MRGFSSAFLAVSGIFYIMLMTNIMLIVTCFPVWLFTLSADLSTSWPWAGLSMILLAPALAGAQAVFKGYWLDASVTAIRTFFRAWWTSLRRVLPVTLGFQALFLLVGVDFYVLTQWGYGLPALPVVLVVMALAGCTAVTTWLGLTERPDLTRRDVLKASLYYSVRKPGWSLLILAVLALLTSILWVTPTVGLVLLLAPGLYVVWIASRHTLAPILPEYTPAPDDDAPPVHHRPKK